MRLLDRLTGTRYPSGGVAPRSSAEVRAALLALGDLAEMRDPLRTAVLDAGWTWRGALLKL
ncbi:hypothetical protein [Streptomyces sp. NPDC003036]|uniref:hypothetical protein n=1 Tax=Streptomyces sp. NPDC003036 TaxID=3154442 RepID=UPI0033A64872